MPYEHDESEWPIIISRAIGTSTDDDLDQYLEKQTIALFKQENHVVIMDSTQGKLMQSHHRQRISDWIKENNFELKKYRKGLAFVSESAMVRGMLTATYWLLPPPYPYKIFSKMDDAMVWAKNQLKK